ncbi:hypothetical protein PybrP1_002861 [[Pythium] brassicae (nom. inval.)]|nr:hypothetical protein PybrP1_002861 [[Pythium] brassicae (nom. inval.)]
MMLKATLAIGALLGAAATTATDATRINFVNKCSKKIELYHTQGWNPMKRLPDIAPGKTQSRDVNGPAHLFRHGFDTDATLAEFSVPGDGKAWYDISIIPPMPGHCNSFEHCKQVTRKNGFNVPMNIEPKQNANGANCRRLVCPKNDKKACADAYHFPADIKTHDCPASTTFDVVFCPNGTGL